jgi:hypothetical protein
MVVVQPETSVTAIPGKSEVAWANEFARLIRTLLRISLCVCHKEILPGATDNLGEALSAS